MFQFLKQPFTKWPYVMRMILGLILIICAFVLSGLIENTVPIKRYFPFTGLILLVFVTWLLYKTDNKNLDELGFNFKKRNFFLLILGLSIGLVAFVLAKFLRYFYTGESLAFNELFDWKLLALGLYYILPMVAVEEFLFRGYLFKKTIDKSNVIIANVVFATAFMLIHILDEQVLSNRGMLVFLLLSSPVGHLLFATALLKSRTILFPIGLHWGNNWASFHLITDAQQQESLSFISNSATFETWGSFLTFILIWNGFYLLLILLIWVWPANSKQAED